MKTAEDLAESLGLRCAAAAEHRRDPLTATAPPAARWLLIEHRSAWPRKALTALGAGLAAEVARLCAAAGIRPVLIRRHGRQDLSTTRRWALVDSRPGQESVRWGDLPTDEHLLNVLSGRDPGTPSTDPIYLICTHGRHDACCAIRGRPAAAALTAAFPDRTWECSHIGGDRFAANLVFLPHSLFYGHVPSTNAVDLATHYNQGLIVPKYLRGSGAHPPPVQAAQHFARTAGAPLTINALHPTQVQTPTPTTWQIHLSTTPTTTTTTPSHTNTATQANANATAAVTQTDVDADTNASTDPNATADAQARGSAQADAAADANAGTDLNASADAQARGSIQGGADPDANAGTDANASADAQTRGSTQADADADARPHGSVSANAGDSVQATAAIDTAGRTSASDLEAAGDNANAGPGDNAANADAGDKADDAGAGDDAAIDTAGNASARVRDLEVAGDNTEAGAGDDADDAGGADDDGADGGVYVVTVTAGTTVIDAAMTCASQPPGHVTTYTLTSIEKVHQ